MTNNRQGDKETRRQGDGRGLVRLLVSLSPCLLVSWFLVASVACGQAPVPKDKTPAPVEPAKVKNPTKGTDAKPEALPGTGDFPDGWSITMSAAEYKKRMDRLALLEKLQLKPEKTPVFACKLTGKLEDTYLLIRAEITFVVHQLPAVVPLGLQPAAVMESSDLDPQNYELGVGDDGYYLKAYRLGNKTLTLNLKVPVGPRRAAAGGGSGERGFDLVLPAAVTTSLTLDLPQKVKEIRCNDTLEKLKGAGPWQVTLPGFAKSLDVAWKEQAAVPGSGPLPSATGNIEVRLSGETSVEVDAELTLEDLRGHKAQEWQLLLPNQAKLMVNVKAPEGLNATVLTPPSGNLPWIIRFAEAHAERFTVHVKMHLSRPANILKIGPFLVQKNDCKQQGTIVVKATPESLRGQKLFYRKYGEVYQSNLPKGSAGTDTVAMFQYGIVKLPPGGKELLDIEFRTEKGMVETYVDHDLTLRPSDTGLQIDVVTNIKVKPLSAGVDFLDVHLPRAEPPQLEMLMWNASAGCPAGVAWGWLLEYWPREPAQALVVSGFSYDEGGSGTAAELLHPDSEGKVRLKFNRSTLNKEFLLTLTGKYVVPSSSHRFRIELPRPQGIIDNGGDLTVRGNEQVELLSGSAGFPEPTSEIKMKWDLLTTDLELAWRPYRPQFPAQNVTDLTLRGQGADLSQKLTFTWPTSARTRSVRLRVPKSISPGTELKVSVPPDTVMKKSEQVILRLPPDDTDSSRTGFSARPGGLENSSYRFVWVELASGFAKREQQVLLLEFHQSLPRKDQVLEPWKVPLIWPDDAVQMDAKVRVWCEPGETPQLLDPENRWQESPTELVPEKDRLPVLVVQGAGSDRHLELTLRSPAQLDSEAFRLPLVRCERAFIRVTVDESGTQDWRARYVIPVMHADALDVEFPAPVNTCVKSIKVGKVQVPWKKTEGKVAHLKMEPFRQNLELDIEYKLSASFSEGNPSWQTVLQAPIFMGNVTLEQVRWQVNLPENWVSLVAADGIQCDWHWNFRGWLMAPEPVIPAGELGPWHRGEAEPGEAASQVFGRSGQEPIVVIHLGRQIWLMVCSGLVLVFGLLLFLMPLPRSLFWMVVLGLTAGLVRPDFSGRRGCRR